MSTKRIALDNILPILKICYTEYENAIRASDKLIYDIVESTKGRVENYDTIYKNFNSFLIDFKNLVIDSFKNDEDAPNYALGAEFAHVYFNNIPSQELLDKINSLCEELNKQWKYTKLDAVRFDGDDFISVGINTIMPIASKDIKFH